MVIFNLYYAKISQTESNIRPRLVVTINYQIALSLLCCRFLR